ncbi:MAG: hypothetical protein ACRD25_08195, partial [Terracidiphilus sp.]
HAGCICEPAVNTQADKKHHDFFPARPYHPCRIHGSVPIISNHANLAMQPMSQKPGVAGGPLSRRAADFAQTMRKTAGQASQCVTLNKAIVFQGSYGTFVSGASRPAIRVHAA